MLDHARFALLTCTLVAALGLAAGCSNDPDRSEAVFVACEETCDVQPAMCPDVDVAMCKSTCDAQAILIETGSACETAYLEFKACEQGATYTCAGGYAFVADECDTQEAACDAACDSPCL